MVKVATTSDPSAVSGAIAGILRDVGSAQVQFIGVVAGYIALKAIIKAIDHIACDGKQLRIDNVAYVPSGTEDITAIRFDLSIS